MKKKLTALLLASALATVTACGSDDDDDGGTGTTTDGTGTDGGGTDGGGTDGGGTDGGGTDGGGTDGGGTDGGGATAATAGSFQVTFTNMTQGQLFTPPVVAIHDPSVHLFQIGEPSSNEIQVIAEMGNNDPLVAFAGANPDVVSAAGVAGAGPFGPGESVTIDLNTTEDGQVFSAVNMIICTNDGIAGVDSTALPEGTDPVVIMSLPYDAGTSANVADVLTMYPPPCRLDPFALPPNPDNVRAMTSSPPDESVAIGLHAGQSNLANAAQGTNWNFESTDEVLMIEITRN